MVEEFDSPWGCHSQKDKVTDREAYIAFNLTEHIGSIGVSRLVARHGSVAAAWEMYPKKTSRNGGAVNWEDEIAKAKAIGVSLITPADEDYPPQLLAASGHPIVLYVKGNVKALSRPSIALVGTRKATSYGLDQAFRFARDLAANGWVVISGLALGIDAECHRGAISVDNGVTVGVIGSALNRFYPEKNIALAREIVEKGGAVVSEFPFGRAPDQQTFPQRNHVVAGLARAVIAVEAPAKSGTMITMGLAADLGRTVMAIPGRVDSQASAGCLALIRSGAILVRSPRDVESEMSNLPGLSAPKPPQAVIAPSPAIELPGMGAEEIAVMREVTDEGISMDELVRKTSLSPAQVNSTAMTLLMKERIRFLPGNRIALPRK